VIADVISTFFALLIGGLIGGFLIGGIARFLVPGPDPMPTWLTTAIGLTGFFAGGVTAYLVFGWNHNPFAYVVAVLLVILYRRFVQKRGIWGREARAQPTRGWGLRR
jgi:uncharacterized membrane protein YeaQ/YmgE (transglycosylase-associated protein family)